MSDVPLVGDCDDRFAALRDVASSRLASGDELGLSIAVDIDGELVVDLYGGWADEGRTQPWQADTIVNVWSTTKLVTSLAVLMLIDRGKLDVDAPIARYWPEFAANGKDGITIRHVMGMTSGVSGWEQPFTIDDLYSQERSAAKLAEQAPFWEPGTAAGYHAANYGHLLGEVIHRVTGRSLKQFVAEEIAGPLDADFQIGAAEEDWARIAPVVPPPDELPVDLDAQPVGSPSYKTLNVPFDATTPNTPGWRRADMGGLNGHGNAVSVARVLSAIALDGTAHGVRLLSPETIDLIFEEQASGEDLVLRTPIRWGVGFALPLQPETMPYIPDDGRICFWGGWGGSTIIMDLERRMTISYMMNKMNEGVIGSENAGLYCDVIYDNVEDQPIPRASLRSDSLPQ
jgi:CubicO group peptidase (beta-lactamase class C family)